MNFKMDSQEYEADVLTRVDDLRAVAADWERLAAQFRSPLLTADWFVSCAETLCVESDLRVVVVRSKGAVCAAAPLVVVKRDGLEWLEILGATTLYEPTGFLYDGVESLRCLVSRVVGFQLPMVLVRLPSEPPLVAMLKELARFHGILLTRRTASSIYVNTNGSWEGYFQTISGARRKRYRYQRKFTERFGEVTVKIERPVSRDDLRPKLDEVFRVEGAGWKGRSGTALLSSERVRRFITRYSERACDRGALRVCFLEVKGIPIATILGVEEGQRFWVLKIGYDEQWARCSPGIQLTMETIKYAFDRGLDGYEFLGSEEPWQAMWPHDRRRLISLAMYPFSPRGLWALVGDLRRFIMKRLQRMRSTHALRTTQHGSE